MGYSARGEKFKLATVVDGETGDEAKNRKGQIKIFILTSEFRISGAWADGGGNTAQFETC